MAGEEDLVYFEAFLQRPDKDVPWGFEFRGGMSQKAVITKIDEQTLASLCGLLVGDRLLKIDEVEVIPLSFPQTMNELKSRMQVTLTIERQEDPRSPSEIPEETVFHSTTVQIPGHQRVVSSYSKTEPLTVDTITKPIASLVIEELRQSNAGKPGDTMDSGGVDFGSGGRRVQSKTFNLLHDFLEKGNDVTGMYSPPVDSPALSPGVSQSTNHSIASPLKSPVNPPLSLPSAQYNSPAGLYSKTGSSGSHTQFNNSAGLYQPPVQSRSFSVDHSSAPSQQLRGFDKPRASLQVQSLPSHQSDKPDLPYSSTFPRPSRIELYEPPLEDEEEEISQLHLQSPAPTHRVRSPVVVLSPQVERKQVQSTENAQPKATDSAFKPIPKTYTLPEKLKTPDNSSSKPSPWQQFSKPWTVYANRKPAEPMFKLTDNTKPKPYLSSQPAVGNKYTNHQEPPPENEPVKKVSYHQLNKDPDKAVNNNYKSNGEVIRESVLLPSGRSPQNHDDANSKSQPKFEDDLSAFVYGSKHLVSPPLVSPEPETKSGHALAEATQTASSNKLPEATFTVPLGKENSNGPDSFKYDPERIEITPTREIPSGSQTMSPVQTYTPAVYSPVKIEAFRPANVVADQRSSQSNVTNHTHKPQEIQSWQSSSIEADNKQMSKPWVSGNAIQPWQKPAQPVKPWQRPSQPAFAWKPQSQPVNAQPQPSASWQRQNKSVELPNPHSTVNTWNKHMEQPQNKAQSFTFRPAVVDVIEADDSDSSSVDEQPVASSSDERTLVNSQTFSPGVVHTQTDRPSSLTAGMSMAAPIVRTPSAYKNRSARPFPGRSPSQSSETPLISNRSPKPFTATGSSYKIDPSVDSMHPPTIFIGQSVPEPPASPARRSTTDSPPIYISPEANAAARLQRRSVFDLEGHAIDITQPVRHYPQHSRPTANYSQKSPAVSHSTQPAVKHVSKDEDEMTFRSASNPQVQSKTFKMLQSMLDDGEEPVAIGTLPKQKVTVYHPAPSKQEAGHVAVTPQPEPTVKHAQYNTPKTLYSNQAVAEMDGARKQGRYVQNRSNLNPSTLAMVQEMDAEKQSKGRERVDYSDF